ncbi:hypothetical protein [Arenicella xantha]|uniref:Carboxypeptidase family protein n=1 Tax=Arenicella xantha TaxID=644221 RepID=A0A395JJ45_9GAMM|nr:hypothetical protein [Arenicella xantha]RBP50742.1 hypothetical protein DFR28_102154 [Arenicella xantha]
MKFVKFIAIFGLSMISLSACAAGKLVNVKLQVVDQDHHPVEGAKVDMGFMLSQGGNSYIGYTDTDGKVEATEKGIYGQSILVTKEGYYDSGHRTGYGDQDLTLELREVKNPIAMYVARQEEIQSLIEKNPAKSIGYDLLAGDFTGPFGKGHVSDLIFSGSYNYQKAFQHNFELTIEFGGDLDGLIPFYVTEMSNKWKSDIESEYKSAYLAPATGYIGQWSFLRSRSGPDSKPINTFDQNRNYYFRVRTKIDEDGNIESAHYGKIYGEFPMITHYFNPTPNDRNVEFDLRKNLKDGVILRP